MTLTVLSDHQVQTILEGLTSDQLDEFSQVLSSALHQYSTNSQPGPNGPYQQPRRIKTHHNDTHATSLYMPSCGPEGMGCKSESGHEPCISHACQEPIGMYTYTQLNC